MPSGEKWLRSSLIPDSNLTMAYITERLLHGHHESLRGASTNCRTHNNTIKRQIFFLPVSFDINPTVKASILNEINDSENQCERFHISEERS